MVCKTLEKERVIHVFFGFEPALSSDSFRRMYQATDFLAAIYNPKPVLLKVPATPPCQTGRRRCSGG